ncbi:glycosyltransferase family 4 protein [Haloferula sargassicola]
MPERYFLNVGRLVTKKNLGMLLQAFSEILERFPYSDISLVLVGDGPALEALRSDAAALGVPWEEFGCNSEAAPSRCIVSLGFLQIEELPSIFAAAEAFVLPSLWEEWGLVINEALACSVPVIVSDRVGCATDLVREGWNGAIFPFDNVEALILEMSKFLSDGAYRAKLSKNCVESVSEWSLDRFGTNAMAAAECAYRERK